MIREVVARIKIAGQDVTRELAGYFEELTFEDNLSGEADTVDLTLDDQEKLFIDRWFPTLSDTLSITLIKRDGGGEETLDVGTFEIDEVEAASPPSTFKIKAVSISQNSALRQYDESKSWENVKLSEIAQEIATAAGLTLFFKASDDPTLTRAEQGEQSRLAFLEKICADNFLALKVSDGQLIIFDESELDKQKPALRISRIGTISFSARNTLQDIYKSAQVSYKHGTKDELFMGSFDSGASAGKVLKINKKVETQAEAERLAKNKLREANRKQTTFTLTMMGDFQLLAGNVVELMDFGKFSGRYVIEKARHSVGKGYEVRAELRRCLDY